MFPITYQTVLGLLMCMVATGCQTSAVVVRPASTDSATDQPMEAQPSLVVANYLRQDCGTGDHDPSFQLKQVLELRERTKPLLLATLEEGPPLEDQAAARRDALEDYERFQQTVREDLEGLENKDVLEAARELDEDKYVSMRMRNLDRGYRERALNALQQMQDPSMIDRLESISRRQDLPADLKQTITLVANELRLLEDNRD